MFREAPFLFCFSEINEDTEDGRVLRGIASSSSCSGPLYGIETFPRPVFSPCDYTITNRICPLLHVAASYRRHERSKRLLPRRCQRGCIFLRRLSILRDRVPRKNAKRTELGTLVATVFYVTVRIKIRLESNRPLRATFFRTAD